MAIDTSDQHQQQYDKQYKQDDPLVIFLRALYSEKRASQDIQHTTPFAIVLSSDDYVRPATGRTRDLTTSSRSSLLKSSSTPSKSRHSKSPKHFLALSRSTASQRLRMPHRSKDSLRLPTTAPCSINNSIDKDMHHRSFSECAPYKRCGDVIEQNTSPVVAEPTKPTLVVDRWHNSSPMDGAIVSTARAKSLRKLFPQNNKYDALYMWKSLRLEIEKEVDGKGEASFMCLDLPRRKHLSLQPPLPSVGMAA